MFHGYVNVYQKSRHAQTVVPSDWPRTRSSQRDPMVNRWTLPFFTWRFMWMHIITLDFMGNQAILTKGAWWNSCHNNITKPSCWAIIIMHSYTKYVGLFDSETKKHQAQITFCQSQLSLRVFSPATQVLRFLGVGSTTYGLETSPLAGPTGSISPHEAILM